MKARLVLTVGAYERYVVAQYFKTEAKRQRATRDQVRRFAQMAVRAMVKEQARALGGRQRAAAERLAHPTPAPELVRPSEQQPSLL